MQTFLPFPSFHASAAVLDVRRLGKQRVEAVQVLRGLVVPGYGWRRHPAVQLGASCSGGAPGRRSSWPRRGTGHRGWAHWTSVGAISQRWCARPRPSTESASRVYRTTCRTYGYGPGPTGIRTAWREPGPLRGPARSPTFRTPPLLAFVDHGSAGSGEPAVGLLWCRHPAPHNWAPKCGRLFSRCSGGIIPPPSHCPCCPCSRRSSARSSSSRCSRALCHQGQKSVLPPSGACLPSMAARAFAATIHRSRFSARPPARGHRYGRPRGVHGRPRGWEGRRSWPGSRPVRRLHEVVGSLAAGGESFSDLPASYVRTGRMGRQRFWELRH